MTEEQQDSCKIDHSMLEYSISRLTDKMDSIQTSLAEMGSNLKVMGTKVDDFSYRLKKLEERDTEVQRLIQKVDLIVQKLEPDVDKIAESQREFEKNTQEKEHTFDTRLTKIENNWGWVVALAGILSGVIVAVAQHIILTVFFK